MMWRRRNFPASTLLSSGLFLRKLDLAGPASLAGTRILFFSDTHFRGDPVFNLCSGTSLLHCWTGVEEIGNAVREAVEECKPEILIFGGDLTTHSCMFREAFDFLASLRAPVKLAVYGNWDKRRRKWLPFAKLESEFKRAGYRLLLNETATFRGIQFTGLDDGKIGFPPWSPIPADPEAEYRCILAHNPDSVEKLPEEAVAGYDLALCGHTHAGQIRLPWFGAVKTSSRYWKILEYGVYSRRDSLKMVIGAGIGATFLPVRFRCPPELILLTFTDHGNQKNHTC